ncbi:hypothetical protein Ddye_013926 [Dipteronia dyeriana]|uniref:Uncharacterized protein n=1 Tax=Dipteronia dyeriana TaxID=168575 RepID=A0AAE0CK14_9ROSI|nr:hypothetical protein Ddye_013926 [Dipteronia dyeriana]
MEGWSNCYVRGSKGFRLCAKAKAVKSKLKSWVRSSKLKVVQPYVLEEQLRNIDRHVVSSGWTNTLKQDRVKLVEELWKNLSREEQTWRQKSRINWLRDGDKNTKFFHSVASGRRRHNLIEGVSFNGVSV